MNKEVKVKSSEATSKEETDDTFLPIWWLMFVFVGLVIGVVLHDSKAPSGYVVPISRVKYRLDFAAVVKGKEPQFNNEKAQYAGKIIKEALREGNYEKLASDYIGAIKKSGGFGLNPEDLRKAFEKGENPVVSNLILKGEVRHPVFFPSSDRYYLREILREWSTEEGLLFFVENIPESRLYKFAFNTGFRYAPLWGVLTGFLTPIIFILSGLLYYTVRTKKSNECVARANAET